MGSMRGVNLRRALGMLSVLPIAAAATPVASQTQVPFICDDGTRLTATFSSPGPSGRVVLHIAGSDKALSLPQVLSADGGRYAEGNNQFWVKGRSATFTQGNKNSVCSARG